MNVINCDIIGTMVLGQYAYDEWGKLLEIDAENEENRAVAFA